ncbi:MAG: aspartyl/glutamyl-tRNA amidotransferase subunit C [Candidatus Lokiarchaeota archaeon]
MKEKELSKETIDYISKLALIDVSEKEKEKLLNQLNEIINYFKKLKDLDTKNTRRSVKKCRKYQRWVYQGSKDSKRIN